MELMTSTQWKVIALSFLTKEPININTTKKIRPNDKHIKQEYNKKKEQIQVQENSDCEEKSTDFPVIEIGI
jgi:hypothetical protein